MTRRVVVPFKIFEEVPPVGDLAMPDPVADWRGGPWYAPRRDSRSVGLDDMVGPTLADYEAWMFEAILKSIRGEP